MRKFVMAVVILLLLAGIGFTQTGATRSTGIKTSSEGIVSGGGVLTGVLVMTDGTNAATITIYDNTTSSGTVLFKATVTGASYFGGATWEIPVRFSSGVYAVLSGTGASYILYYSQGG